MKTVIFVLILIVIMQGYLIKEAIDRDMEFRKFRQKVGKRLDELNILKIELLKCISNSKGE